jgi:hypothetical protein
MRGGATHLIGVDASSAARNDETDERAEDEAERDDEDLAHDWKTKEGQQQRCSRGNGRDSPWSPARRA